MYLCHLGGGVSLSANNAFTGNNTFSGTTTLNNNLTLPTTYSTVPTTGQLGGISEVAFASGQLITSAANKSLGSITLPSGGTYLIILSVNLIFSASGTISRFVIEASTNSEAFSNNISQSTQRGSWPISASQGQVYTTCFTYATTTSATIYGTCAFNFSGTATAGGKMSYTRLA